MAETRRPLLTRIVTNKFENLGIKKYYHLEHVHLSAIRFLSLSWEFFPPKFGAFIVYEAANKKKKEILVRIAMPTSYSRNL